MKKYHYSKSTGEVRPCLASLGNCPLASLSEHFEDKVEAIQYAEEKNFQEHGGSFSGATHNKNNLVNLNLKDLEMKASDFSALPLEAKKKHQQLVLDTAMNQKRGLTKYLKGQHQEFVNEVITNEISAGRTTNVLYAQIENGRLVQDAKGKIVYTPERQKQQEAVLDHFMDKYKDTPSDKKSLVSGGLGGAGKGHTLFFSKGIDADNPKQYAVANPDDIKEEMAERGMIPKIEGTTPMDLNTLAHEEASMLTKELQRRLIKQEKNIVFDRTISKTNNIKAELEEVKRKGYEVEGVFVDVTQETSENRAGSRYTKVLDEYLVSNGHTGNGGRFLPAFVNSHQAPTTNHNSLNAENFQELVEDKYFDKVSYFDNNTDGKDPKEIPAEEFLARGEKKG